MASKCCKLALLLLLSTECLLVAVRGDGVPRSKGRERVLYAEDWAVQIVGGEAVAQQLAEKYRLVNRGRVGNLQNVYHFSSSAAGRLQSVSEEQSNLNSLISAEEHVVYLEQQVVRKRYKRGYVEPNTCVWQKQWSLRNTGQANGPAGLDLNVERGWLQELSGSGVVVAVVDDGLDWRHPALYPNYNSAVSYDFLQNDADPMPEKSSDSHGTGCAGEIAMIKDSTCGAGVAYNCSIAGIKFNVEQSIDVQEGSALSHRSDIIQIYSNSWGPIDDGTRVEGPGSVVQQVLENGVFLGRNKKGSIFVWAAGNGGEYNDSCAADGYASSIYTIAVGSADQQGKQAYYDENCAAKMATTYSYNSAGNPHDQIRTTSLNNECTDGFTGTSASAPLVAGTIALALEANPNLTWRDVQYLIVYTSDRSKLVGGDWITNGAGLTASNQFGFGAIDAETLVARARGWITVPEQRVTTVSDSRRLKYRLSESQPYVRTIQVSRTVTDIVFLEHVSLSINTSSCTPNGAIQVLLTSPRGTRSTLLPFRGLGDCDYNGWPFVSVHFWGEDPVGNWKLEVDYRSIDDGSVMVDFSQLLLYGTDRTPAAVARIPNQCDPACARSCGAAGPSSCDACRFYRIASNRTCVPTCGSDLTQYNNYCVDRLAASSRVCSLSVAVLVSIAIIALLCIVACAVATCIIAVCCIRSSKKKTARTRHLVACEEDDDDNFIGDYFPSV